MRKLDYVALRLVFLILVSLSDGDTLAHFFGSSFTCPGGFGEI